MDDVVYECGSTAAGDLVSASCPMCGAPIAELTEEDAKILSELIVLAVKELGEIAECVVKGDPHAHWRYELGDLCGLAIKPMLRLANMRYAEACEIGIERKNEKIGGGIKHE